MDVILEVMAQGSKPDYSRYLDLYYSKDTDYIKRWLELNLNRQSVSDFSEISLIFDIRISISQN